MNRKMLIRAFIDQRGTIVGDEGNNGQSSIESLDAQDL